MAFTVPGNQNAFVPTAELSGNLAVKFGGNVKDYAVNKILRKVSAKKTTGFYWYFNPLDYARMPGGTTTATGGQFDWAPGTPRPSGDLNHIGFELRAFQTRRYAYSQNIDLQGEQQADYPVLQTTTEALATLAMTHRAKEAADALTDTSNYPSTHVATATAWGGGLFNAGTETNPIIKKALLAVANRIHIDSRGNAGYKNMTLVMNPTTALGIAPSQEIHSYLKYSRAAVDIVNGKILSTNERWGLPDTLYGMPVVIEDTTVNLYNRGASGEVPTYVFPDNVIAVVCREQDFEASEGANSYSTFHLFTYKDDDMKVESRTDTHHRLIELSVVDQRQVLAVAGITGALITAVLS